MIAGALFLIAASVFGVLVYRTSVTPAIKDKAPGTWRATATPADRAIPLLLRIERGEPAKYAFEYELFLAHKEGEQLKPWGGTGATLEGDTVTVWFENRMSPPAFVITYRADEDELIVSHGNEDSPGTTFERLAD